MFLLIISVVIEIWNKLAAFILYYALLFTTFYINIGAYEKFLAILFKWDYFLKIITGKDIFNMFLKRTKFDPICDKIILNNFFCKLICSSSVQMTPPFLYNLHSLNNGCSVKKLFNGCSHG